MELAASDLKALAVDLSGTPIGAFEGRQMLRGQPLDGRLCTAITSIETSDSSRVWAAGSSTNRDKMSVSSFGEAIERYSLCNPSAQMLARATYRDLEQEAVDPAALIPFSDKVYDGLKGQLARFDKDEAAPWVRGRSLIDARYLYVPACAVFTSIAGIMDAADAWIRPISTGTACHSVEQKALESAILEVIERDAISCHFEAMVPGACVAGGDAIIDRFLADSGLDAAVKLTRLYSDTGTPVVLAGIHSADHGLFGAGAAAHWSEGGACIKALEEAALTVRWMKLRHIENPSSDDEIVRQLHSIPPPVVHADYYALSGRSENIAWVFNPIEHPVSDAGAPQSLKDLLERIAQMNLDVIACDITHPSFEATGLRVIRVIIPGFVPLARGFHYRPSQAVRLHAFAKQFSRAWTQGVVDAPLHPLP